MRKMMLHKAQLYHKGSRPGCADAPATWKLNDWMFMVNQSVRFVATSCSHIHD